MSQYLNVTVTDESQRFFQEQSKEENFMIQVAQSDISFMMQREIVKSS